MRFWPEEDGDRGILVDLPPAQFEAPIFSIAHSRENALQVIA